MSAAGYKQLHQRQPDHSRGGTEELYSHSGKLGEVRVQSSENEAFQTNTLPRCFIEVKQFL